jgi:NAD-dependent dihydropyrimidine dehydrogenase PreA subunit
VPTFRGRRLIISYVIAAPYIDIRDRSCTQGRPVGCIYEGARTLCVNPSEGFDCGGCEPVYPVADTTAQRRVGQRHAQLVEDTRRFFVEPQPGRDARIAAAAGSYQSTPVGVDTALLAER